MNRKGSKFYENTVDAINDLRTNNAIVKDQNFKKAKA